MKRIDENSTKTIVHFLSPRRTMFTPCDLTPGKYVSYVQIKYDPNYEQDFEVTLAVYSEYVCEIRLATKE